MENSAVIKEEINDNKNDDEVGTLNEIKMDNTDIDNKNTSVENEIIKDIINEPIEIEKENKNESIEIANSTSENDQKDANKIEKPITNEESQKIFHENLNTIKKIQENILSSTLLTKEKIISANEISVDQLKIFSENSQKYGKYLKAISGELFMIQDLMKKIKLELEKDK